MFIATASVSRCRLLLREELLENMRQELVGGHVLAPGHELTGRDLVEDGGGVVIPGGLTDDIALQLVDRALQPAAVSANEADLVSAHLRD